LKRINLQTNQIDSDHESDGTVAYCVHHDCCIELLLLLSMHRIRMVFASAMSRCL